MEQQLEKVEISTTDGSCLCGESSTMSCLCSMYYVTESNETSAITYVTEDQCWSSINLTALAVSVTCKHYLKDKKECESHDFMLSTDHTTIAMEDENGSSYEQRLDCFQLTFQQDWCDEGFVKNSFSVKRVTRRNNESIIHSLQNDYTDHVICIPENVKSRRQAQSLLQIIDPLVALLCCT